MVALPFATLTGKCDKNSAFLRDLEIGISEIFESPHFLQKSCSSFPDNPGSEDIKAMGMWVGYGLGGHPNLNRFNEISLGISIKDFGFHLLN